MDGSMTFSRPLGWLVTGDLGVNAARVKALVTNTIEEVQGRGSK